MQLPTPLHADLSSTNKDMEHQVDNFGLGRTDSRQGRSSEGVAYRAGKDTHVRAACLEKLQQVIHGHVRSYEGQRTKSDVAHVLSCFSVDQHQFLDQHQPHNIVPACA